jgi:hypothetical protein
MDFERIHCNLINPIIYTTLEDESDQFIDWIFTHH